MLEKPQKPPVVGGLWLRLCCISKIPFFLKAIHNMNRLADEEPEVVLYLKDTVFFESNSQPIEVLDPTNLCCVVSQRYRFFWKQFTTILVQFPHVLKLCCISKIPFFLKAIHNWTTINLISLIVVLYLKDTVFFESNSQHGCRLKNLTLSCVVSQRYRFFWKQFTTAHKTYSTQAKLCCISKIPFFLKAIHNYWMRGKQWQRVVLYLKDTVFFESNSQLRNSSRFYRICCVVSQRYRFFWKQFTTDNVMVQKGY